MTSTDSFVHLHVHTEYSLLDGAAHVKDLALEAARLGMPALAMTDHGNMLAAYDFAKACDEAGIKPIIGMEAYCTPGDVHRTDRRKIQWGNGGEDDISGGGAFTHMTLLSTTTTSLKNLFRLSSLAYLEGVYKKPRIDRELLNQYGRGLVATTGCPSGEIQTLIRLGQYDKARAAAGEFKEIFGDGHFFVELMDHGINVEKRAMADLLRLAKDVNLPLLATNDLHYVRATDAARHDHLLCINSGSNIADEQRFRFDAQDFYLKTPDQMRALWREFPEACDNTLLVAEMVDANAAKDAFASRNLMPKAHVPAGMTEEDEFKRQVWEGLKFRYPDGVPDDRIEQAKYEVGVINQMGFPGYFLVVADFINWAKENGIRVGPGRGSGAGSIAAYAMRITDLDPMVHGLIFERFLNPERVSMPDFDIDFDEKRRGEVIQYVTEKYGTEYVAQIVTLGRIKAKAALKDAARISGHPFAVGDKLTKALPPDVQGKGIPLSGVFDPKHPRYKEAGEFRSLVDGDPELRQVVEVARGVEGFIRSTGIHAAGVIMSAEPLMDVIPVMKPKADGGIVTQFEYPTCEALGMVKMDFLGLSNLTTIDEALKNIHANRGITVDLTELDRTLDDPKTFELLAKGDTLGVFQLDGGPMRSLLRSMRPDNFEDISAVLALYRPGPMGANAHNDYADRKTKRKPVVPIHPELAEPLKDILGDTYGLIVYQEQVMAIAQKLAGYTLGGADLLRRAMGKKKKEILDKEYVPFRDGMAANGYSDSAISTLWEILVPFSEYAFNKAHSAAYGVISYYTAYLKANYPAEYMAALLTTNQDDKTKVAIYLNECRRMGINVLAPDVNESQAAYTAVGDDIRVGLETIRNVGAGVVASIISSRNSKGRYTSFIDFLDKSEAGACHKRVVESLNKAGAFDTFGHARRAIDVVHAQAVDSYASLKKQEAIGQDSLFGGMDDDVAGAVNITVPDIPDWDKKTRLGFERDMLGLYVSDHPLNGVGDLLRVKTTTSIGSMLDTPGRFHGTQQTIGGLLTTVEKKTTKKGDTYAAVTIEDLDGHIDVLCFPGCYRTAYEYLRQDEFVLITGKIEKNDDDTLKVIAENVRPLDPGQAAVPDPIALYMPERAITAKTVAALKGTLADHPGGARQIELHVAMERSTKVLRLPDECKADLSPEFITDLKAIFGNQCLTPPQERAPQAA